MYQGHEIGARCYQRGAMGQAIRILGIDPGLRRTGWGLIGCEGNRLMYLACGSVETNERLSLAERLAVSEADLHTACEMIIRGCAHETAAEILL